MPLESTALARLVFDAMSDKQSEDIVILDIRPVSLLTDFFVIGSVDNPRQLAAVVDSVTGAVRGGGGGKPVVVDGTPDSGWVLIDFGTVMAHVFDVDRRRYYDLESMWREAPMVARMA